MFNKKPYSQYLCNSTQLYMGACAVYIITLTNEMQPLLPGWNRWLITCAVLTLIMMEWCQRCFCVSEAEAHQTRNHHSFCQSQGPLLQLRVLGISTWGCCNRGQLNTANVKDLFGFPGNTVTIKLTQVLEQQTQETSETFTTFKFSYKLWSYWVILCLFYVLYSSGTLSKSCWLMPKTYLAAVKGSWSGLSRFL